MVTAYEIVCGALIPIIYERVNRLFALSLLDDTAYKFHQNCFALLFCPQLRRFVENMPQFQSMSFHNKYQVWVKLANLLDENAHHFGSQWQVFHEQAMHFKTMEQQHKNAVMVVNSQDYELHHPFDYS
jgi:hypothetical protein